MTPARYHRQRAKEFRTNAGNARLPEVRQLYQRLAVNEVVLAAR